jgi:hypothetical protein
MPDHSTVAHPPRPAAARIRLGCVVGFAALVAVVPVACAGSGPAAGPGTAAAPWHPSIPSLLASSHRLALTSEQIDALDSIGRVWSARDDSLHDAVRSEWGGSRPRSGRERERARPLQAAMLRNDREAATAAGTLLDAAQREAVCGMDPGWPWCAAGARRRP